MSTSTANHYNQGIRISPMLGRLPKFNGRQSIEPFLRCIAKRATLEQWSGNQTADVIRYLCTDVADSFISIRSELKVCSLETLKSELRNRFKTNLSKIEARIALVAIKQGSKTVPEYLADIEITVAQLADTLPELANPETRDDPLIAVFMAGLNPKIKCLMSTKEFQTFFECVESADRCEKSLSQQPGSVNFIPSTSLDSTKQQFGRNALKCWKCHSHGHIQRHCPVRANTPMTCWQCGKTGHPMRLCKSQLTRLTASQLRAFSRCNQARYKPPTGSG